ncbi:hypothetical protein BB558_006343 [Smittium angustum]|uniref:PPM-type phosphatase domain-containing protein n=1 Tax=Smittium angustum TaxID=133377 RepID=A0A2U1IY88_SMIAN|nr:hypothetical protein BB558_006343 [Smittium angustum]
MPGIKPGLPFSHYNPFSLFPYKTLIPFQNLNKSYLSSPPISFNSLQNSFFSTKQGFFRNSIFGISFSPKINPSYPNKSPCISRSLKTNNYPNRLENVSNLSSVFLRDLKASSSTSNNRYPLFIKDFTMNKRYFNSPNESHSNRHKLDNTLDEKNDVNQKSLIQKKYKGSLLFKKTLYLGLVVATGAYIYNYFSNSNSQKEINQDSKTESPSSGGNVIIKSNPLDPQKATDLTKLIHLIEEKRKLSREFIRENESNGIRSRKSSKKLEPLENVEVDALLTLDENHMVLWRPNHKDQSLNIYSNQVSSNTKIEDYITWESYDSTLPQGEKGNRQFFGVFDGHAGYMCAEKISSELPDILGKTLSTIDYMSYSNEQNSQVGEFEQRILEKINNFSENNMSNLKQNKNAIALASSFVLMDEIVVHDSVKQFYAKDNGVDIESKVDMLLGPAVSGSCGIGILLDNDENTLTVANTGDSRAVLGSLLPSGKWKSVELSVDQTADNKKELLRIKKEHPGEESTVIIKNRVLGGLMPTRAFGDSRYKWDLTYQNALFPLLYSRGHKYATTPNYFLTPPYVTAQPVIVQHKIRSGSDKFIIIATDGLWDRLTSQQAVDVVGSWIDKGSDGTLGSKNQNPSSNLIKLSLSYDYNGNLISDLPNTLLAIPSPYSRRYRDDISVYVIVF